jgi:NHL repeat
VAARVRDFVGIPCLAGNNTIRKVTSAGVVTTLAGLADNAGSADGLESSARFYDPQGVAVDSAGNVYVADTFNNTVRKVNPAGAVTTLGGAAGIYGNGDGTGSAVRFNSPNGVAVDSAGNVYVADFYLSTIRKGSPALTIANSGFSGDHFGFNLTGPAGRAVIVEASTDLVSWLPIWTNTVTDALNFSDQQTGFSSNRFYRAHLP